MPADHRLTFLGLIALVFAAAAIMTLADVRLASSQTVTLVAHRSEDPIPDDAPFDSVWARAPAVETPLSAQAIVPPKGGGDRTVTARAMHYDQRLYILLEWDDSSADTMVSQQNEFSDAAAVQFPVTPGEVVPSFCMGDTTAPVNIWQWKAAWQTDMEQGFVGVRDAYPNMQVDFYPFEDEDVFYPARAVGNVFAQEPRQTAADNLLAGSFGTLTQAPDQLVQGSGEWRERKWRVLFVRDLDVDGDYTQFAEGDTTNVAFAVWDGFRGERDGIKSVSQFLSLEVSPDVREGGGEITVWTIVLIVLGSSAVALVLALFGRRRGGS